MKAIKYIDGNQQKGIAIDWNFIYKEYKKLKCPDDIYDPTTYPINVVNWGVLMSARSRGKTTAWLLIGLLLYKHYGIQTGYVRQTDRMTTATKAKELYNVVCEYGYITKIFGEEWNSIYLYQKHWYLCKRDDDGNIVEKCTDDCTMMLSVDKSAEYKSTLTKPRMDLILFDEMISNNYRPDEFIDLCQLISTIKRKRISTKIICLSNMVTPYNQYLNELCLREVALKLKAGEHTIVESPLGLKIYYEVLDTKKLQNKTTIIQNISYFGFPNKQLSAITGEDWEIKNYPHLPRPLENESREIISRDCYVYCFGNYICMEFWHSDILGYYVNFRPYPLQVPDNAIIFTDGIPTKSNEFYGMGENTPTKKLWNLYFAHRDFYAYNDIGHMIENFINALE